MPAPTNKDGINYRTLLLQTVTARLGSSLATDYLRADSLHHMIANTLYGFTELAASPWVSHHTANYNANGYNPVPIPGQSPNWTRSRELAVELKSKMDPFPDFEPEMPMLRYAANILIEGIDSRDFALAWEGWELMTSAQVPSGERMTAGMTYNGQVVDGDWGWNTAPLSPKYTIAQFNTIYGSRYNAIYGTSGTGDPVPGPEPTNDFYPVEIKDSLGRLVYGGNVQSGALADLPYGGKFTAFSGNLTSNSVLLEHKAIQSLLYSMENGKLRANWVLTTGATPETKYRLTFPNGEAPTTEIAYNVNTALITGTFNPGAFVRIVCVVRHYDGANYIDSPASDVLFQVPGVAAIEIPAGLNFDLIAPDTLRFLNTNSTGKDSIEVQVSNAEGVFTGASIIDLTPESTEIGSGSTLGQQLNQSGGIYSAGTVYIRGRFRVGQNVSDWAHASYVIAGDSPPVAPGSPVASWNATTKVLTLSHAAVSGAGLYLKEVRKQGDNNWYVMDSSTNLSVDITEAEFNQIYPTDLANGILEVRYQAIDGTSGAAGAYATATVEVTGYTVFPIPSGVVATLPSADTLVITYGQFASGATRVMFQMGRSSNGTISWGVVRPDASAPDINIGASSPAGLELSQSNGVYVGTLYYRVAWANDTVQGPWYQGSIQGQTAPTFDVTPSMQVVTAGSSFNFIAFTAVNGTTPVSWSITGLPAGVSAIVDTSNSRIVRLQGTVAAAGNYTLSVTVTDNASTERVISAVLSVQAVQTSTFAIYDSLNIGGGGARSVNLGSEQVNHRSSGVDTPNYAILWGGTVVRKDTGAKLSFSFPNNADKSRGIFLWHKAPLRDEDAVVYGYSTSPYNVVKHAVGVQNGQTLFNLASVNQRYGWSATRLYMSESEGRCVTPKGVVGIAVQGSTARMFYYLFNGGFVSNTYTMPSGYPYPDGSTNNGATDIDYYHCPFISDPDNPDLFYVWYKPRPGSHDNSIRGISVPVSSSGFGTPVTLSESFCYHGGPGIYKDASGKYRPCHVDASKRVFDLKTGQRVPEADLGINGANWTTKYHTGGVANSPHFMGDNGGQATMVRGIAKQSSAQLRSLAGGLDGDLAGAVLVRHTPGQRQQYLYRKGGNVYMDQI